MGSHLSLELFHERIRSLETQMQCLNEENIRLNQTLSVLIRHSDTERQRHTSNLDAIKEELLLLRHAAIWGCHSLRPHESNPPDLIDLDEQPPELVGSEEASVNTDVRERPPTPQESLRLPLPLFPANAGNEHAITPGSLNHGVSTNGPTDWEQNVKNALVRNELKRLKGSQPLLQQISPNTCVFGNSGNDQADRGLFYTYGIRYEPKASTLLNRQRVVITNIPSNASESQVIARVRGGVMVSFELLDALTLGTKTALVRFIDEIAATSYDDFMHAQVVKLGSNRLMAEIIPTDSYPLCQELTRAISDGRQTRCLKIENFPVTVTPAALAEDLNFPGISNYSPVDSIFLREGKVLEISFTSVNQAARAFGIFSNNKKYSSCKPWFALDPCAGPLEELHGGIIDRSGRGDSLFDIATHTPSSAKVK